MFYDTISLSWGLVTCVVVSKDVLVVLVWDYGSEIGRDAYSCCDGCRGIVAVWAFVFDTS